MLRSHRSAFQGAANSVREKRSPSQRLSAGSTRGVAVRRAWKRGRWRGSLLIGFFSLGCLLSTTSVVGQQASSARRALTHSDYDAWQSIAGATISRDGLWVAYALLPQDGDGDLVVRQVLNGKEWRHNRGWRIPTPTPSDPEAAQTVLASLNRITRPLFTADGAFLLFIIEPSKAEVLEARRAKKKPSEMPRNALGILQLSTGELTRIERVKSFSVPESGGAFVACLLEPESSATPPPPSTGNTEKWAIGSRLTVRNLTSGQETTLPDVLELSLSRDGRSLVYTVSSTAEESNGVYLLSPGSGEPPLALLQGEGRYAKVTWDEDQTQLAFLVAPGTTARPSPRWHLYHWKRNRQGEQGPGPASEIVSPEQPAFPANRIVSDKATLSFARDGSRLFFGLAPSSAAQSEPASEETGLEETVIADLWHWKDDFIQPMQKVRANQERNKSYRAVFHLEEKRMVPLADETMESIAPSSNGLWAIGQDDRRYRRLVGVDANYADLYLVNTLDGSRRRLREKNLFPLTWSPGGKYAVYFDGKDWHSISIPDGQVTNLTATLPVRFWEEDHDTPNPPPPYGIAGWTRDDRDLLLYDRFDIWQVSPNGSGARNLTDGVGRQGKLIFRYVRLDPEERWIDGSASLLLRAENEESRESGFYRDRIGGGLPDRLLMAPRSFSQPTKAKDAETLFLTASRFDEYPDLLVTDGTFQSLRKVSEAGKQLDPFLWGKAELIQYRNTNGLPLSGILIKPANFDPTRKYPLMVYLYEKLSNGLHRFVAPGPGTSINPSLYASNGYVVLMPDIVYTIGYPGESALQCVVPAVEEVVRRGFIQEDAIGIQGHSWGGYQIAYLVTRTDRFRAAAPGAVVANMTSAYSGVRWGSGMARQFQYERTQSRIGGSIWEYPMQFLENSPLFNAHRVRTPILMVHNDQDDAVPWTQGIEFFLALRRLDREAYLFNYNGEYHGLRRRPNQKDYTRRLQEFFDHHLKGAAKPDWMERGIPYLEREEEKKRRR